MNNLKKLMEKRADLKKQMLDMLNKAGDETRALTEEEGKTLDQLKEEYAKLGELIKELEEAENVDGKDDDVNKGDDNAEAEARAFEDYIRGVVNEERADVNFTQSDNGAIIPSSIANKIIEKLVEISPIYQMAERYNIAGNLSIPYYDEETQSIEVAYVEEFEELTSTSGKFTNIQLGGFLAGVLTKISKSLINKASFNLTDYVVKKVAEAVNRWLEKEALQGTAGKIDGCRGIKLKTTMAGTTPTSDELIDTQDEIIDVYQNGSVWIMTRQMRTAIRKLKDNDGKYLLNPDVTAKWGYTLLGKDVYTTHNALDKIFYGDFSGLAVKVGEDISIDVLREKFATQHAIGVVGYLEVDMKVQDTQKLVVLSKTA